MATITLYANKINTMPGLFREAKSSVKGLKTELTSFKRKCSGVNRGICNLDDVISSVSAATQTQEEKIDSFEKFSDDIKEFASDATRIDDKVSDMINKNKDDFYDKYDYLKPDSEKSTLERIWNSVKKGCKKAGEWCKEHWKEIVTVVLVVAAIVAIVLTGGAAFTPIAAAVVAIAKGILIGTVIGGVAGGLVEKFFGGGSFREGFRNGAFEGAISGALTGGLGHWLSLGGKALTLGNELFINGFAETVTSLVSDLGDILLLGENISGGDVLFNAGLSLVLSLGSTAGMDWLMGKKYLPKIKIQGFNKGNGSWAHVWASQSARSLNKSLGKYTNVSVKTILKGMGAEIIDNVWNYCIEPIKNVFKDSIIHFKEEFFVPQY